MVKIMAKITVRMYSWTNNEVFQKNSKESDYLGSMALFFFVLLNILNREKTNRLLECSLDDDINMYEF